MTKVNIKNGIEIRDVADLLGYKNIETTEIYYISSTDASKMLATNAFEEMTHSEIIDKIIKNSQKIEHCAQNVHKKFNLLSKLPKTSVKSWVSQWGHFMITLYISIRDDFLSLTKLVGESKK